MVKYEIKPDFLVEMAEKIFEKHIQDIKNGKVIRRRYADATTKKRRKYGLSTGNVTLTGSTPYSGKSWRLLDSLKFRFKGKNKIVVSWSRQDAARIAEYHIRRFGNFFNRRK